MTLFIFTALWCVGISALYSMFAFRSNKGNAVAAALFLTISLAPYILVSIIFWSPTLNRVTIIVVMGIAHAFLMVFGLMLPIHIEDRKAKKDN